jgi:hypothetical protein
MELLIFWFPIAGSILIAIAGCIWYGGSKSLAKKVAALGILLLLMTGLVQFWQYVRQGEQPFVFVTGLNILPSVFSPNGIRTIEVNGSHAPTLIGQPRVNVYIKIADRSALDIDAACEFIITNNLPPERPPTNQTDITLPRSWPGQFESAFGCVCPFTISKTQQELLATKA